MGAKAAEAYGKPSVRFCHGYHEDALGRLMRRPPALTVFNSHSLLNTVGYYGEAIICHPQVDPSRYRTEPGDHITLVNLLPQKGGHVLDQLARYLPARQFLGVEGGYNQRLGVEIVRRNVEIVPNTRHMRERVYSRTRILLMPSLHESWGMVGIEAMCSGIPVIAHPTPGLVESLGDAGLFAHRDNLDDWIDTIEELDKPNVYRRYSKRALKRVEEFSGDDSLQRFVERMEKLM